MSKHHPLVLHSGITGNKRNKSQHLHCVYVIILYSHFTCLNQQQYDIYKIKIVMSQCDFKKMETSSYQKPSNSIQDLVGVFCVYNVVNVAQIYCDSFMVTLLTQK